MKTEQIIALLGRDTLNTFISHSSSDFNAPLHITKEEVDALLLAFCALKQTHSTLMTPEKLNFSTLITLNSALKSHMKDPLFNVKLLDKKPLLFFLEHLPPHQAVRILVPGNDDVNNPLFIAEQISQMREYKTPLTIQVLFMGDHGHSTTGNTLLLEPEAKVLSSILEKELLKRKIPFQKLQEREPFAKTSKKIQILCACHSTNTGENVQEALLINRNCPLEHFLITASITGSRRQTLTFALQMRENYISLTGIPQARSLQMIAEMSDKQVVIEYLEGLIELNKELQYSFNAKEPFVLCTPFEFEKLETLYKGYAALCQKSLEEAKQDSLAEQMRLFNALFSANRENLSQSLDLQSPPL